MSLQCTCTCTHILCVNYYYYIHRPKTGPQVYIDCYELIHSHLSYPSLFWLVYIIIIIANSCSSFLHYLSVVNLLTLMTRIMLINCLWYDLSLSLSLSPNLIFFIPFLCTCSHMHTSDTTCINVHIHVLFFIVRLLSLIWSSRSMSCVQSLPHRLPPLYHPVSISASCLYSITQ